VVTLRTYLNPTEAALVKSLLDDHKIFCSLADENVNIYGGGPLAMPIRLLVADEQVEEARRILEEDAQPSTEDDPHFTVSALEVAPTTEESAPVFARDNPWELLVMASLFLIPAICLLLLKHPLLMAPNGGQFPGAVLSTSLIHGIGWLAVAVAFLLTISYFYARHSDRRNEDSETSSLS
jgi:hypothetical protein